MKQPSWIIIQTVIDRALSGDQAALTLCLERILPPRKDHGVTPDLPTVEKPSDLLPALNKVLAALADGSVTPMEAKRVQEILDRVGLQINRAFDPVLQKDFE